MENRTMKFLKVDKKYFNNKLKPLEILIVAQVEEFNQNGRKCYLTNQQFAEMFSVGTATVARTIDSLVNSGYLIRNTQVITDNGQASRMRYLSVANFKQDFEWSF